MVLYFTHCMLNLEQNLLTNRDANTNNQNMYICRLQTLSFVTAG